MTDYENGRCSAFELIAGYALKELGAETSEADWAALRELTETREALKRLFERYEIEWPGDELHLVDVIEKHFSPVLADAMPWIGDNLVGPIPL